MKSSKKLTKAEQLEAAKMAQIKADMKAHLKSLSKNDLIRHIFEQLDLYYDLRNLAQSLHKENLDLKKQSQPIESEQA